MSFHRSSRSLTTLSIVAGLWFFGAIGTASAALMHEFVDTRTNTVVGSIEFSDATPGTVTAFSLSGFGGPTLGLSDICSPGNDNCEDTEPLTIKLTDWSIDSDDWGLDQLFLVVDYGDFFEPGSDIELLISFLFPAGTGVAAVEISASACPIACTNDLFPYRDTLLENLNTRPAEQVDEPSALILFGVGLAGLVFMRRRKRKNEGLTYS